MRKKVRGYQIYYIFYNKKPKVLPLKTPSKWIVQPLTDGREFLKNHLRSRIF